MGLGSCPDPLDRTGALTPHPQGCQLLVVRTALTVGAPPPRTWQATHPLMKLVDNEGGPRAGPLTSRQDLLCGAIHVPEFSAGDNGP